MRYYIGGRTRAWLHLRTRGRRARLSLVLWEQHNGTHTITLRLGLRGVGQISRVWCPAHPGWLMHDWTW